jgi:hypothetical protein
VWVGDASDPPAGDETDVRRASMLVGTTGIVAAVVAVGLIAMYRFWTM